MDEILLIFLAFLSTSNFLTLNNREEEELNDLDNFDLDFFNKCDALLDLIVGVVVVVILALVIGVFSLLILIFLSKLIQLIGKIGA
jgi:hypothetical protein